MLGRRAKRSGNVETIANLSLVYREASWDGKVPATVKLSALDQRSGLNIFEATMSAEAFIEFMKGMGGPRDIPISFFAPDLIGKHHSHESYEFPVLDDDETGMNPKPGPRTQAKIDALEGGGDGWEWHVQSPTLNNRRQWVVIRRRYTDEPVPVADSLNPEPKPKKSKKKGKK